MGRAARTGDLIVAFSATDEALSLSQTQSNWLEATNRLKLLLDVRPLQADLVRADRICPIASFTGSREHGAPPSAQCPAAEVLQAANLRQHRSADICRTVWLGAERAERLGDREARNRNPLAPRGVSFVLAMEVKIARWSSEAALRH